MLVIIALLAAVAVAAPRDGVALYRDREFAAAEDALRKALTRNPNDADARLYLARTLIEVNRSSDAVAEIEKALSGHPGPEVRFQAGRILRELAERRFGQLEAAAPGSPPTLELAGQRFERSGNLDEALKRYRASAALDPKRPGAHYRIGNVLWRKREVDAAAQALQRELTLTPHHGMANLRMGEILINGDRAEEAIPYLQRATEALPDSIEPLREIGKAYRKTGQNPEARKAWEAVAKARPDDDQIHYLLGNLYREMGEAELARRELELHRSILERRRQR